jgi:cytidine deaminase
MGPMEKAQIEFTYHIYQSSDDLDENQRLLLKKARGKLLNAYAPYSEFRVAAAIELANGELVFGTNQENAAYPSGLCAERVAIFAAKSNFPDERIVRMAITAQGHHEILVPIPPCGACR